MNPAFVFFNYRHDNKETDSMVSKSHSTQWYDHITYFKNKHLAVLDRKLGVSDHPKQTRSMKGQESRRNVVNPNGCQKVSERNGSIQEQVNAW